MLDAFKTLSLISGALVTVAVGGLVYLRAPGRHANRSFFLASIFISIWAIGNAAFINARSEQSALLIAKIFYIAPLFAVYLYFALSLTFPNTPLKTWQMVALCVMPILLSLVIFNVPSWLFIDIEIGGTSPSIRLSTLPYALYSLNILIPISLAIYYMASRSNEMSPVYAQQAKILSYGMLFSAPFGLYFNLVLPWFEDYSKVWLGPNAISMLFTFAAYGILKHRLFVLRKNILRAIAPLLLVASLLAIYVFVSMLILSRILHSDQSVLGANWKIYVSILIMLVIPYYFLVKKTVNHTMFHTFDHTINVNTDIASLLVGAQNTERMLTEIVNRIAKTVNCDVVIYSNNATYTTISINKQQLKLLAKFQKNNEYINFVDVSDESVSKIADQYLFSCSFLIDAGNKQFGYLIVGDRKDGFAYTQRQYSDLQAVAKQIALGLIYLEQIQEINSFNETLKEKINRSTKELKQANNKLRKSNQYKDDLISIASHQLMPQLSASRGLMELELPVAIKKSKIGEMLFDSNQRMTSLVSDMLNIGRIESGRFSINLENRNLTELIYDQISLLKYAAKANKIRVVFEYNRQVMVSIDRKLYAEAIYNLLDNAIQYGNKGSDVVVMLNSKNNKISLAIINNGIELSESDVNKVTSKFYRSKSAIKMRPGGTGIGLYFVKSVCVAHGHKMTFAHNKGLTEVSISFR